MSTYLTASQLAERIPFSSKYINNHLKDSVLLEGHHYVRPFGGRRVVYIWEAVEEAMLASADANNELVIPMVGGGVCRG
jgi:hypothetical protein